MKKKIMSAMLAVIMVLSLFATVAAEGAQGLGNFKKSNTYNAGKFSDVSENDWFCENVKIAYELGLVKGNTETTFNPKGNVTLAETIALACRLHSIYNGGTGEMVQGSPWYKVYVDYALENKLIPGAYSDYNAKITRANFAYILANAIPAEALQAINNISDGELCDVADDYRKNAIYMLYRAGVLSGNDEFGTFNPNSTILRSEVAAIITRMAVKSQRKSFVLKKNGKVSEEIYRGALAYIDIAFQGNYGISLSKALDQDFGGETGAEILKEETINFIKEFEGIRLFAIDNGLELTDAERKMLEDYKKQDYEMAGGKEAFISEISASGLTEEFYDYFAECQVYYNKISELFAVDAKYGISSEEVAAVLSGNYVRVKHILIQADSSQADYETKKALARKILKKISSGEDFEKLLEEYGEDPGMTINTSGYIIDSQGYTPDGTQMIPEFTEASIALKVGGVSDVVPSAYGLHIIKRYPIDEAFIASYIKENGDIFKANALEATIVQYIGKVEISNIKELEKIDIKSVFNN